jgi:DNA-directed RNA polymerase subunit E'/Rpb7
MEENASNIYFNCILKKKINVEPKYLNNKLDEYIYDYLKKNIEGKCIAEGYIKKDTIKVIKKSVGMLLGSRFNGDITYEVIYTADVCNPLIGNVIDCKVKFINKLGILGHNGPITIVVRKQFNGSDNQFDKIGVNDNIKVEIIAKKFHLNDKEIQVVSKIYNENEIDNGVKKDKKIVSSDLTQFNDKDINEELEDDMLELNSEDQENINEYDYDKEEDYDEYEENDENEEIEDIELKNPDENNIDAYDIELDDYETEDEEEDEEEDDDEYE